MEGQPVASVSKKVNRQSRTVYSVGGLGNQLFVWAFARWLQKETGARVELSHAFLSQNSGQHNSFAADLPFTSRELEVCTSALKAFRARLGIRLAKPKDSGSSAAKVSKSLRLTKFEEVGFCGGYRFEDDLNGHQYVGYFQTFRYFQDLGVSGVELLDGVSNGQNPVLKSSVAIHLRHGDYREQSQLFGVLPTEYYIGGLKAQIVQEPVKYIKVFGLFDDQSIQLIEELMHEFPDIKFDLDCLTNPKPATVELKMLAQFGRQVISNSSYSWWACTLAEEGLKVAPACWFRGMPEPLDLVPSNWMRVPFSWRD
jgi:hypothetical protein